MTSPLASSIARRVEEMMTQDQPVAVGSSRAQDGALRVPSQRELAEHMGVSRASVREALMLLAARGLIRTEPGRRSFWQGTESRRPSIEDLSNSINDLLWGQKYPNSEISRFRHMVEGRAARLAAMRITDDQIQELERNLAEMKKYTRAGDLVASAETDFAFHQAVIRISGVRLFKDLHLTFRNLIMQTVPMTSVNYTRLWEPVDEHQKIIDALKRRDPDEALYYARSHIVRSADRLGIIDAGEIL